MTVRRCLQAFVEKKMGATARSSRASTATESNRAESFEEMRQAANQIHILKLVNHKREYSSALCNNAHESESGPGVPVIRDFVTGTFQRTYL